MFLLFACAQSPGDFSTMLSAPKVVETVAEVTEDGSDTVASGFASERRDQACIDDPLNCEDADDEPIVEDAPVVDVVEAVVEVIEPAWTGVQEIEPEPVDAPPAVGMPSEPAWGIRLMQTLHTASPPRAALGLPNGDEVVVAPGSILADVGVIVVAVGDGMVQLAHVQPEGDHAEIETVTLTAQYGRSDG
ncbi:MAG: hypothetical protein GY913_16160 [Proteobacteria bacterium]|nr:hypothetical protein [Pseudomonadota bacterium]MCP4918440.1 hypothetical protein [Pseudomonadota bacterium]